MKKPQGPAPGKPIVHVAEQNEHLLFFLAEQRFQASRLVPPFSAGQPQVGNDDPNRSSMNSQQRLYGAARLLAGKADVHPATLRNGPTGQQDIAVISLPTPDGRSCQCPESGSPGQVVHLLGLPISIRPGFHFLESHHIGG
jgi:hypothetical protein